MSPLSKARDTGLAMVLLALLALYFFDGKNPWLFIPVGLLILAMAVPAVYTFLSPLWFGLAHGLGAVVSNVIFTLIFFTMLTPIGILRKGFGYDPMGLKKWKTNLKSAFEVRDHIFSSADLKNPF